VIIDGEGVVESRASKLITSPIFISFESEVISAFGVVDERPVHPEIETNNIIQHIEKLVTLMDAIGISGESNIHSNVGLIGRKIKKIA
jgi:hypothetical protein